MQFAWQELIDRARVYIDDDHNESSGWLAPEKWLTMANVEYAQLYRKWARMGLVVTAPVDVSFIGPSVVIGDEDEEMDVLAIVGVAEDLGGGQLRALCPAQSELGVNPWWSTFGTAPARYWKATASGDEVTVTIEPADTATYIVRYIPTTPYATDPDDTIELPYGCDERLVLGIARRAKVKDSTGSSLLERLLYEADADINMTVGGRIFNDSPRARIRDRDRVTAFPFPRDPTLYRYL